MLLGPHSLVMSTKQNKSLFFTDCGPFGETSLDNAKGSVFQLIMSDVGGGQTGGSGINPLTLRCLAQPTGLALSRNEDLLYVSETGKNRLLRFVQAPIGVYYYSVFHQFSGGFGPIDITVSDQDILYVARYQFKKYS